MERRIGESVFSAQAAGRVLARLADGESLMRVCGRPRDAGLPERTTVHRWTRRMPGFALAYGLARLVAEQMRDGRVAVFPGPGAQGEGLARWRARQARVWAALVDVFCEGERP